MIWFVIAIPLLVIIGLALGFKGLTGWMSLIFAVMGPIAALLLIGYIAGFLNKYLNTQCDNISHAPNLGPDTAEAMKRVLGAALVVAGLLPSEVGAITSVIGIVGGLLDNLPSIRFWVLAISVVVIFATTIRPVFLISTYGLYDLDAPNPSDVKRVRDQGKNPENIVKTHLQKIEFSISAMNWILIYIAITCFLIRNWGVVVTKFI